MEKTPSEVFNPNPETQKFHLRILKNIEIFGVGCHFFTLSKTFKNQFFDDRLRMRACMIDLTCGKKLVIALFAHLKYEKNPRKIHENIQS